MTRLFLRALTAVLLSGLPLVAAPDFHSLFASPPPESRILKIIHSWPDSPAAQDDLIASLSAQGFGGVVCNLSFTDYLQSSNKWQSFARAVQRAKDAGFALWLYDEKGYPSATAGGLVLRDRPEWEAKGLLVALAEVRDTPVTLQLPPGKPRLIGAMPLVDSKCDLSRFTNLLAEIRSGALTWKAPSGPWRLIAITESPLYEGTHAALNLADHIPYPNLLEADPTARFLALTHQAYAGRLGNDLGRFFVATFTDEPSLMSLFLKRMPYAVLPWSDHLPAAFKARHGYNIEDHLPALALEIAEAGARTPRQLNASKVRYDFWSTVGDMISENYFGQIQTWCRDHGVLSGGHLLMEENLVNQVGLYGNFFQCLRRLDSPGIDCLTSIPEQVPWFIARLAGSAADLEGRSVTMCETSDHSQRYRPAGDTRPIRKVTPDEIRGTCNRLMVSGIDTITSYYSFDGLGSNDLKALNQYVGRCCFALKGGHQVAEVAVLYPAESAWIRYLPSRHYALDSAAAARIENTFRDTSEALFAAGRDFTYVDGRALSEAKPADGTLRHGDLQWHVIVLPGGDTLPIAAWQNLSRFVASGGILISIGDLPRNSESAFPDPTVTRLADALFQPGRGAPSIRTNSAGGAGIFLPAGVAGLVPDILNQLLERDLESHPSNFSSAASAKTEPASEGAIRYTHRRIEGRDRYFVINDSKEPWRGTLSFCAEIPGEQCDPQTGTTTGRNTLKTDESGPRPTLELKLPPYGSMLFSFAKARPSRRLAPPASPLPGLSLQALPLAKPVLAQGEFVNGRVNPTQTQPTGDPESPAASAWQTSALITKSDVDTFLFLRFPIERGSSPSSSAIAFSPSSTRAVVLDTWVPDSQRAPTQLLLILHERSGADYLAQVGRFLNSPGHEQSWVTLDRFQLAGWSNDPNGRLDPADITELRVGWGGYFGIKEENITFTIAPPRIAQTQRSKSRNSQFAGPEPPESVDLRPVFDRLRLAPRVQGSRPTCSVFTVVSALEFALASDPSRDRAGQLSTNRLSVDFLNWAANKICGDNLDGGFFSDLWKGYQRYGICSESLMSYQPAFDPARAPSSEALDEARAALASPLLLHWIKPWDVKTGLRESEFTAIKRTLSSGWPVCAGLRWPIREQWSDNLLQLCPPDAVRDGHSILLLGYRDDATQPGGGSFLFRNTSGPSRHAFMPYSYARQYMNDAVWIELEKAATNRAQE